MRRFQPHIGRRGGGGSVASAMSLMPALAAWWEPGRSVTVTEAVNATPNTFTAVSGGVDLTTGQADPLGGTNATQCLENAAYPYHYVANSGVSNAVVGELRRSIYAKSIGGRNLWLGDTIAGDYSVVNLATGAVLVTPSGWTVSVTSLGDGWYHIVQYGVASNATFAAGAASGTTLSYVADPAKGIILFYGIEEQHRASALADQSPNGYHLAQATAGSQPFVQKADGSSPGGNLFTGRAAVWNPGDNAKTAACTEAGLLTAMTVDHTFVADVYITAAATAAVPLLATAGGVAIVYGIDTSRRPYVTCGTTLTGTALAVGRHQLAFVRSGNIWTLYADKVIDGAATELVPGGDITPTSVTMTQRCMGYRAGGISGVAMNAAQIAAAHTALAAGR